MTTFILLEGHMQNLPSLISNYLEICASVKKLSADTIKAYRTDLEQFSEFTNQILADKEELRQYIKYINQHYAPRSVKRKLASIRAFYRELFLNEILETNPFDKLRANIHSPKQLPRVISIHTVQNILQSAYNSYSDKYRHTMRDIVVLELLFNTGMRVAELCALTKESFILHDNVLRILINGKGQKQRVIQITNPELLALFKVYCKKYDEEIKNQGYILYNQQGHPLSPQSVRRIINKYVDKSDLNYHITPHMFRHTFATVLLEEGVDIKYIQALLGHSSISTTQIYTQVAAHKQTLLLAEKHPRSKMKFELQ